MQAAFGKLFEGCAIVCSNPGKPNVQFVGVIFRAHIERGADFRQRAEPIFTENVGDVLG